MVLLPCRRAAAGPSCATFSGSCVASPEILKASQCVMSVVALRMCASGSCTMSTKLTVPLGGLVHCNSGEIPVEILRGPPGGGKVAVQVYFCGIGVTSVIDVLEIIRGGGGGPAGGPAGACCAAVPIAAQPASSAGTTKRRAIEIFICSSGFFARRGPFPAVGYFPYVTRQIEFDPSSVTISEPSVATATPTGRPQMSPLSVTKPIRKSLYSPRACSFFVGTNTTSYPVRTERFQEPCSAAKIWS